MSENGAGANGSGPRADERLRLGGMALRNGLLIHGPTSWAVAARNSDGEVEVASGPKPSFTPGGLGTWGDGRLTILGTDGFIEVRKNVDIGGRPGGSHLFLVDQKETRIIDCKDLVLPYGERLVDDILNRTETSMPQAHVFLAMELALRAQAQAQRVG